MKVEELVSCAVDSAIEGSSLKVWNIKLEEEGCNSFLRVYVYKDDGYVTLDECEAVSRSVSCRLDELDSLENRCHLEVFSVGLERKLSKEEHFLRFMGSRIVLKLFKGFGGRRKISGILRAYENLKIKVETEDEILTIPYKNCAYVKLVEDDDYLNSD